MAGKKDDEAAKVLGRELGVRILYAHMKLTEVEDDHVSLAEFGKRVADEERRLWTGRATRTDYSASSVSRWESGDAEPGLLTILAITSLVNRALRAARRTDLIDPGFIAFGAACGVEQPQMPTFTLSGLAEIRSRRSAGRRRGR